MSLSHPLLGSGFRNWAEMLVENISDIPLSQYPKLAFLTATVISGIPLRTWEKVRFNKYLETFSIKSPIFIIGYYRSGTTFLHYLLSCDKRFAYPETYQVMLPNIFLTGSSVFKNIIQRALPETRPMDNLRMGAGMPKEEEFALLNMKGTSLAKGYVFPEKLIEYHERYVLFNQEKKYEETWKDNLNYFLKKVTLAGEGKPLVVKTPANTARIKQLLELFPDARFIHIRRNPLYVYHSNMKMLTKIVKMMALTPFTQDQLREFLLYSYESIYKRFDATKQLIPYEQLATIEYENYIQDPISHTESIYNNLNIDGFKTVKPLLEKELKLYRNYTTNEFVMDENSEKLIKERWKNIG